MEEAEGVQKYVHYFISSRCFLSTRPEIQRFSIDFKGFRKEEKAFVIEHFK